MVSREVAVANLLVLCRAQSTLQMKVVIILRLSLRSSSLPGLTDGAGLKGSPWELPRGKPAAVFSISRASLWQVGATFPRTKLLIASLGSLLSALTSPVISVAPLWLTPSDALGWPWISHPVFAPEVRDRVKPQAQTKFSS